MTIDQFNFAGKKAFVRVDFNVPLDENFNITDDTRMRAALPTLKKILADGGSIIIGSHLGRPKGVADKFSLKHILKHLSELLGVEVQFANDCMGEEAAVKAAALQPGEVLLLENLRFYAEEEGKPRGLAEDASDEEKAAAKKAQIENVEEFMSWGDMDENGKPISKDKGRCYEKWKRNVRKYGYDFDWRILNAANYGAYTTRKRYFGIFAKRGLPIVFPEPTHCKDGKTDMMGRLEKWNAVKEVLDFTDEGDSIFCRKKPLAEKTLERIYAGLIKFVAGGKDAFISRYNTVRPQDTCTSIEEPVGVVTTANRFAKVQVSFLSKQYSGHPESKNISVEEPAGTITCKDHHAFITAYYGNGNNHSVERPAPTVTTKDKLALLTPVFIDQQFGASSAASIEKPLGAITTNPKYSLVTCKRKSFLMNPQFASAGGSVDNPCFTLIARMDKMPPYLVNTKDGIGICIENGDSPMTVKIKQFMILYGLADIKMRMLRIDELKKIMGFPEDYILIGTQSDQKKFIGNAVEVNMARVLCEAICKEIIRRRKVA